MWSRGQLKDNAKSILRNSYWKAFLVGLIFTITIDDGSFLFCININEVSSSLLVPFLFFFVGNTLVAIMFYLAVSIFLLGPLEVGVERYFLESTQMRFNINDIGYSFSCGRFRNIVTTMLLQKIYLLLWTLLFIIPGIVKFYAYSMVPFLMAENPNLSPTRAIEISCDITQGHKWDMFVLELSFLGWYLLGALGFGIGMLFVTPYSCSTRAQLYLALRNIALDKQLIKLAELESH